MIPGMLLKHYKMAPFCGWYSQVPPAADGLGSYTQRVSMVVRSILVLSLQGCRACRGPTCDAIIAVVRSSDLALCKQSRQTCWVSGLLDVRRCRSVSGQRQKCRSLPIIPLLGCFVHRRLAHSLNAGTPAQAWALDSATSGVCENQAPAGGMVCSAVCEGAAEAFW